MPGANVIPMTDQALRTPANATELGVYASPGLTKASDLMARFIQQFRRDSRVSERWRRETRQWYALKAGKQWDNDTLVKLRDEQRPALTFNRIKAVTNVVRGIEISNRQEVTVYPRQEGDAVLSDEGTEALKWIDQRCQADTEESMSFEDMLTCGIGVTETRIDYLDDPKGKTWRERVFPLSVFWDANATKRNLTDARRVWRVKIMERDEAQSMYPDVDPFDLDADWTGLTVDNVTEVIDDRIRDYQQDNHRGDKDWTQPVRLVQLQWWERAYRFIITGPEGDFEVPKDEVRNYRGLSDFTITRRPYKLYKYAVIGRTIIATGDLDPGDRFHFQFMTGDYDEIEGYWYGIVRSMKDPQQWANKTVSNIVHILSSMRKGGILYESDFFVNAEKAKRDLAKPNPAIEVVRGGLSGTINGQGQRYQELTTGSLPSGIGELLEFSKRSIYECAGVPMELLAQDVSDQLSGVQEYERRRAGITLMAHYFDSLKLYRVQQAELSFDFIRAFHQGQLIRVLKTNENEEMVEQFVPILLDEEIEDYDFVIDDSPASPNQKERAWQLLLPLLPAFIQMNAPPEMMHELLRASPLPARVVERIVGAGEETEEEKMQRELLIKQVLAELAKTESEAKENLAQAQKAIAGAGYDVARAQDLGFRQGLDTVNTLEEMDTRRSVGPGKTQVVDIQ